MVTINLLARELAAQKRRKIADKQNRYRGRHPGYAARVNETYRQLHPDRVKQTHRNWYYSDAGLASHLRRRYNITLEQYKERLAEQNDLCAGCGGPPVAHGRNRGIFCVDHDHVTKQVRGLLCWHCNVLLGHAKDKPETLQKLLTYLEKSNVT